MQYVALKRWNGPGGPVRYGDAVPEAKDWKNPGPWIAAGWVKEVPDAEVVNGRWVQASPYLPTMALPGPPAAPAPEPESEPQPEEQDQDAAREFLRAKTKSELLRIADQLGLPLTRLNRKSSIVESILAHGEVQIE